MKHTKKGKLKIAIVCMLSVLLIATAVLVNISKTSITPNSVLSSKNNLELKHNHKGKPELKGIKKCDSYQTAAQELNELNKNDTEDRVEKSLAGDEFALQRLIIGLEGKDDVLPAELEKFGVEKSLKSASGMYYVQFDSAEHTKQAKKFLEKQTYVSQAQGDRIVTLDEDDKDFDEDIVDELDKDKNVTNEENIKNENAENTNKEKKDKDIKTEGIFDDIGDWFKDLGGNISDIFNDILAEIKGEETQSSAKERYNNDPNGHYSWGASALKVGATLVNSLKSNGYTAPDREVIVGIIDTGINPNHSLFKNRIASGGYDFSNGGDDNPADTNGHGTHCAGIVADMTRNMPVKVLPLKIFPDQDSNGNYIGTAGGTTEACHYAVEHGVSVISMSVSNGRTEYNHPNVEYLMKNGVSFVCSSGNDSEEIFSKYCTTNNDAIIVGNLTKELKKRESSNIGDPVDVAAPGSDIFSADYSTTSGLCKKSGTSMATPHVAALAAMIKLQDPTINPATIQERIKSSCLDLGDSGKDKLFGYGLPQATDFLRYAGSSIPSTCSQTDAKAKLVSKTGVTKYYVNFISAVKAAQNGDTVQMLGNYKGDVFYPQSDYDSKGYHSDGSQYGIHKGITVDLNGYYLGGTIAAGNVPSGQKLIFKSTNGKGTIKGIDDEPGAGYCTGEILIDEDTVNIDGNCWRASHDYVLCGSTCHKDKIQIDDTNRGTLKTYKCICLYDGSHTMKTIAAKTATCTETGNSLYYTCTKCGTCFSDLAGKNQIAANSWVIPAKGHELIKIAAKEATYETAGNTEYYVCNVCGKYFSDSTGKNEIAKNSWVIPAKGHELIKIAAKEATCTTAGNIEYYKCSDCGKCYSDSEGRMEIEEGSWIIPAKHTLAKITSKAATCTTTGNMEYYRCTSCNKYFSDLRGKHEINDGDWVIPLTNHDLMHITAKDATCTEEGNCEYWTCDDCGKAFWDAEGKNQMALGRWITSAKGHALTKTAPKASTCTIEGHTAYWTCRNCGKVFADAYGRTETLRELCTLPLAGHNLTHIAEKDATCTEEGNCEYWTCEDCGKAFSDADGKNQMKLGDWITPVAGHEMVKTAAKAATCTTEGNCEYWTCRNCKKVFVDVYGRTLTTKEQCTKAALGHSMQHIDAKEATIEEEGCCEHWVCSICREVFLDESGTIETTIEDCIIPKLEPTEPKDDVIDKTKVSIELIENGKTVNNVIIEPEIIGEKVVIDTNIEKIKLEEEKIDVEKSMTITVPGELISKYKNENLNIEMKINDGMLLFNLDILGEEDLVVSKQNVDASVEKSDTGLDIGIETGIADVNQVFVLVQDGKKIDKLATTIVDEKLHFNMDDDLSYQIIDKTLANQERVNAIKALKVGKLTCKSKKKKITVKWKKISNYKVSKYLVYRSTKKNKGFKKIKTLSSTTFKEKKALKKGKKYYYKVLAQVKSFDEKTYKTKYSPVKAIKCK